MHKQWEESMVERRMATARIWATMTMTTTIEGIKWTQERSNKDDTKTSKEENPFDYRHLKCIFIFRSFSLYLHPYHTLFCKAASVSLSVQRLAGNYDACSVYFWVIREHTQRLLDDEISSFHGNYHLGSHDTWELRTSHNFGDFLYIQQQQFNSKS